jgi:hypothetical protein
MRPKPTIKAIREAVEKSYGQSSTRADSVEALGEQYQKVADTLDSIMQAQLQIMNFCQRIMKNTNCTTKERMDAAKLLMQATKENSHQVASTIQFWQKIGVQPPKPAPVRKPPDLSIPVQPKYNGPPEPEEPISNGTA